MGNSDDGFPDDPDDGWDEEGAADPEDSEGLEDPEDPDDPEYDDDVEATGSSAEPAYETSELPQGVPAFLIGALAGMLVLGLVWWTVAAFTGGDKPAADVTARQVSSSQEVLGGPSTQHAGHHAGHPAGHHAAHPGPGRLHRCRAAATVLAPPLRAAGPALDQWEVHVGAMNKLVVGAISLQQATAFWDQTRVGAKRHVAGFDAATRRLRGHEPDCPPPSRMGSLASPALRSCVRHVASQERTLQAARTAIGTWSMHVEDMEMLRMGHLSAAAASQMWLASWKQGVRELQAYRDAAAATAHAGRC